MKKNTNNYRRCAFCPHHQNQKPCCCETRKSIHTKTKNTSLTHSRPKKKVDNHATNASMSYINNTLPISHVNPVNHPNSSILIENSILRTQNDMLKKQINSYGSGYQNISVFTKDDIPTHASSQFQTARTNRLQDKLFYSNKNLQEALIQLDTLSKVNKQLNQANTRLQSSYQKMKIQFEQMQEETYRLKRKNKKMIKILDSLPNQQETKTILQANRQLKNVNSQLEREIEKLKKKGCKCKKNNNWMDNDQQNLSPEWVAHTSTKLNALERNISKIEEENKENIQWNHDQRSYILFKEPQRDIQELQLLKYQIGAAIKALKIQSSDSHFSSSAIDQLLVSSNAGGLTLIKGLCEALLVPILVNFSHLSRQVDRKIKQFQAKFQKTVSKMRNMTIKISNQRLRSKSLRGCDLMNTRFA